MYITYIHIHSVFSSPPGLDPSELEPRSLRIKVPTIRSETGAPIHTLDVSCGQATTFQRDVKSIGILMTKNSFLLIITVVILNAAVVVSKNALMLGDAERLAHTE
jgi:hypothetical protein